jgi:hypothetical protein
MRKGGDKVKNRINIKVISIVSAMAFLFLCFPGTVLAAPDAYGYNAKANHFHGTLANWENFIYGRPVEPYNFEEPDTIFILRKWDKNFNNAMFKGEPFVNGAWQQAHLYSYPSDQPGWVWNYKFKMVYSCIPVQGATAIEEMPGFYIVQEKEWFTDPQNNEHVIVSNKSKAPALGSGFYK